MRWGSRGTANKPRRPTANSCTDAGEASGFKRAAKRWELGRELHACTELQLNCDNNERGMAVPEDAQHKLVQLCSLLAALRAGSVLLEVTEETQINLLWLAHDLALDVSHTLCTAIAPITGA